MKNVCDLWKQVKFHAIVTACNKYQERVKFYVLHAAAACDTQKPYGWMYCQFSHAGFSMQWKHSLTLSEFTCGE